MNTVDTIARRGIEPVRASDPSGIPAAKVEEVAPFLSLKGIHKTFGAFRALDDIDLQVREGEFVCFLGPSGCGKSTLLRIIAGLEQQTSGSVFHGRKDIGRLPPAARHFGILFQSYALFPNLTVAGNISYGLHNQKMPSSAVKARVQELLELVEMTGTDKKFPGQLSGGQQQRVALARAIAPSPKLLLLDEPLSALDAKVRVYLREKIRELQTKLGLTTIMVTHDQEEALTMADRIVVMNSGTVDQIGSPDEIYNRPKTRFVANFVGKTNFIQGTLSGSFVQIGQNTFPASAAHGMQKGKVEICIRPEHIRMSAPGGASDGFLGRVEKVEFLGAFSRIAVSVDELQAQRIVVDLAGAALQNASLTVGDSVQLLFDAARFVYLPHSERG